MTDTAETSPQAYARIGVVLYLSIIVIGFCSEFFVSDKLVVSGDVTATANNIMASESLWRISIAGDVILLVRAVPLTLILYVLLKPVNKHLALLALFFNIVEFPIEAVSKMCLFAASRSGTRKHARRLADLFHEVLDLIVIPWPYVLANFRIEAWR